MLVMCLFVETGCSNLYRGGELGWGGGEGEGDQLRGQNKKKKAFLTKTLYL